jgi:hypothetical protein
MNKLTLIPALIGAILLAGVLSNSTAVSSGSNSGSEEVSIPVGYQDYTVLNADGGNEIEEATLVISTPEGEKEYVASAGQSFLTKPEFNNRPKMLLVDGNWVPVVRVEEYGHSLCDEIGQAPAPALAAAPEPTPVMVSVPEPAQQVATVATTPKPAPFVQDQTIEVKDLGNYGSDSTAVEYKSGIHRIYTTYDGPLNPHPIIE